MILWGFAILGTTAPAVLFGALLRSRSKVAELEGDLREARAKLEVYEKISGRFEKQ